MRIHLDAPAAVHHLHRLCPPGVYLDVTVHGSRTRDHAAEVHLYAYDPRPVTRNGRPALSRRRPNGGTRGGLSDVYAATYDEWGAFLARVFATRSNVTIPRVYADAFAFHRMTGGRFSDLDNLPDSCEHKFALSGQGPDGSLTYVCPACGARRTY